MTDDEVTAGTVGRAVRLCVLDGDVTERGRLILLLERAGCVVVAEGRSADDAVRLHRGCDVVVVAHDADLAEAVAAQVPRAVVLLNRAGGPPPHVPTDGDGAAAIARLLEASAAPPPPPRGSSRPARTGAAGPTTGVDDADGAGPAGGGGERPRRTGRSTMRPRQGSAGARPRIVAIGASAGGPSAVSTILGELGQLTVPVVIAQHQDITFSSSLLRLWAGAASMPVRPVEQGRVLSSGVVHVGPPGHDLVIGSDHRAQLEPNRSVYRPNVDALLTSVARVYGAAAVGVVLTGMGDDGAAGLLAMFEEGALTIAQDRASCAVYGMPAAAVAVGAVVHQVPLLGIAAQVRAAVEDGR